MVTVETFSLEMRPNDSTFLYSRVIIHPVSNTIHLISNTANTVDSIISNAFRSRFVSCRLILFYRAYVL